MSVEVAQLVEHGRRRPAFWSAVLLGGFAVAALATVWWFDPAEFGLPTCTFHAMTGLHCPGCGATRATHELLHGRPLTALHNNALWVLLMPAAVYAVASEIRYMVKGRPLPGDLVRKPWLVATIALASMVFAVVRNLPVYPLALLAPPG